MKKLASSQQKLTNLDRQILNLQSYLIELTKPANIMYSPLEPVWLTEVISTYNKIEQLQKKSNKKPTTVGEYYKKHLK